MMQVWIAICAYLLLAWIRFKSQVDHGMQQMLRLLQLNIGDIPDLIQLVKGNPPQLPDQPLQTQLRETVGQQ